MGAAEVIERLDDAVVGAQRLRRKARQRRTVVVGFVKLRVFVDGAAEKAAIQRAVGNKADAEFLQDGEHFFFRLPPHEVVLALNGCERAFLVGGANRIGADFAHAEMLDLAFFDEVGHGAGDVFGRNGRVKAMLIEEVDGFNAEIFQGFFANAADVFRTAVEAAFDFFYRFRQK